jgi:hypothetical protein
VHAGHALGVTAEEPHVTCYNLTCYPLDADTRGGAYKRVVWYLVTDSIAIKKAAVAKYGERLLTDVSYVPAHIQDHTARWVGVQGHLMIGHD